MFEFRFFVLLTVLCAISLPAFAEDVDAGGDVADVAVEPDVMLDASEDVLDGDAGDTASPDVSDAVEPDAAPDVSDADVDVEPDALSDVGSSADIVEDTGTVEDAASDTVTDVAVDDAGAVQDVASDGSPGDVQLDSGSDAASDTVEDAQVDSSSDVGGPVALVTVTGLVRLRQNFDVQREVTVRLGEGSGAPFVTALSGEAFEWVDVPSGNATVVAVAEGFGPSSSEVEFSQGAMFELLLYPTALVALRGRVLLPDGSPANGARVSLSGRDQVAGQEQTSVTDGNGTFGWTAVVPGLYRLSAESVTSSFVSERWEILSGGDVVIVLVDDGSRTPFEETGCSMVSADRAAVSAWWLMALGVLVWFRRGSARA